MYVHIRQQQQQHTLRTTIFKTKEKQNKKHISIESYIDVQCEGVKLLNLYPNPNQSPKQKCVKQNGQLVLKIEYFFFIN